MLYKIGGFKVVLTNPGFYSLLEQGDKIIVLGYNIIGNKSISMKEYI